LQLRITTAMAAAMAAALAALAAEARAQTDYYNTDRGRPLRIEDAYPVERRAFEIQAAPLRLERFGGGVYRWTVEPEIAYGVLPRTQLEVGVPVSFVDAATRSGVSGLDVSVLHNLNVETGIPALAVAASALLPVGNLAPDDSYFSFTGIATRTFSWMRFHLNGEYTIGDAPSATSTALVEATRWTAGIAVDRTFPLKSLLIGAEVVVQQPLIEDEDKLLSAGAGVRYQLTPRWALDGGIGKTLTGDERAWHFTFGSAYAFGLPWAPKRS
jgi:hypothetical protein